MWYIIRVMAKVSKSLIVLNTKYFGEVKNSVNLGVGEYKREALIREAPVGCSI